jgi:hypothetical protein
MGKAGTTGMFDRMHMLSQVLRREDIYSDDDPTTRRDY